jgi:hypothetical protein
MSLFDVDHRRAIIDRRALADRSPRCAGKKLSARSPRSCAARSSRPRRDRRRLIEEPGNGRAAAQATAFLHDQLVRLTYDFVDARAARRAAHGDAGRSSASAAPAAARWRRSATSTSCS